MKRSPSTPEESNSITGKNNDKETSDSLSHIGDTTPPPTLTESLEVIGSNYTQANATSSDPALTRYEDGIIDETRNERNKRDQK